MNTPFSEALTKKLADQSKTELDSANTQAVENIAALEALGDVTELAKNVQTNTNNINTLQENVASNTSQLNNMAQYIEDLKNTTEDTRWLDLPLANSSNNSGYTCQYRRIGKQMYLRGIITGISTIGTIATLPIGFRPATNIKFILPTKTDDDAYCKFAVLTNGNIIIGYSSQPLTIDMGFYINQLQFSIE